MDKLEFLLNEFDPRIASDGEYQDNIWLYRYKSRDKTISKNAESYICSRQYEFIKWLVNHKKINFDKLDTPRFNQLVDNTLDSYFALLMALSIQNEPMTFLNSILK